MDAAFSMPASTRIFVKTRGKLRSSQICRTLRFIGKLPEGHASLGPDTRQGNGLPILMPSVITPDLFYKSSGHPFGVVV
jgi:hypothetical protein